MLVSKTKFEILLIFVSFEVVPDVEVNRSIVHGKVGSKVKLDCIVSSYPKEKVHWFFNELPLITDNRVVRQEMDLVRIQPLFSLVKNN